MFTIMQKYYSQEKYFIAEKFLQTLRLQMTMSYSFSPNIRVMGIWNSGGHLPPTFQVIIANLL